MNYQEKRKLAGEYLFIKDMITHKYPSGIISLVSDTFDFWKTITIISSALKDEILNRPTNALGQSKVVFRPDSGDPVYILAGYKTVNVSDRFNPIDMSEAEDSCAEAIYDMYDGKFYSFESVDDGWDTRYRFHELQECEVKGAVECLWNVFGGKINSKGFKELDEHVGLIYGDSITLERANEILSRLKDKGFASSNVVFGIGSYEAQYVTRDTYGFAVKATYSICNGKGIELFKDPITDNGTKKSARGLLRVEQIDGKYVLFDQQTPEQETMGCLETVFKNGNLVKETNINEIRQRVENYLS